MFFLQEYKS